MPRQLLLNLPPTTAGARRVVTVSLSPPNAGANVRRTAIAFRAARQGIMLAIAQEVARMTRSNFGASGPYRPFPWPPYSRRYARKHPGPPTLIRSGALAASVSASATINKALVTAEGTRNYAAAQQFGVDRNKLPARPYFPIYSRGGVNAELTAEAQRNVERVYSAQIKRILGV